MVTMQEVASRNPLRSAALVLAKYRPIDVKGAIDISLALGCSNDTIKWRGKSLTVKSLLEVYKTTQDVCEVPICFYGGPVCSMGWYTETLGEYILDRVANLIILKGYGKTKSLLEIIDKN